MTASVLSEMAPVPRALRIATEAHAGQTDLAGEPYIWHCLRVMEGVNERAGTRAFRNTRAAALLHDTLEDTSWTTDDLIDRGISEVVASTVVMLTHQDWLSYEQYIERLCEAGKVPRMVKIGRRHGACPKVPRRTYETASH